MTRNLSSLYQIIPTSCSAYDYDDPGPPFSPESIAAIDSIKEFLSASELAQARRLETVYYNPRIKDGCGTFIPGLRSYPTSLCLYVRRYDERHYAKLLDGVSRRVFADRPETEIDGVNWPWFRVTTPDGGRNYPLSVHKNIQTWKERMIEVAEGLGTTVAWFDRGKFCSTDGRCFPFGDLTIDRVAADKPTPKDW